MPKVRIDRIAYEAPTRKDHLIKVPREALYISFDDEGQFFDPEEMVMKVRYSGILCDSCNDPIPYPYVWLIVCGNISRGTVCEKCRKAYWNGKPAFVLTNLKI